MSSSESNQNSADPLGTSDSSADSGSDSTRRARAVSELFREHNQTLVRFLAAKLQNEQEACEVAQEAYVRLLELGRTGAVGFLRAYLFRIAQHLAIDRIRSRNARERISAEVLEPISDLLEGAVVERHVFAADEMKVLWASLSELPESHRQAFEMSRLRGLSTAEIALRLGRSDRMIRRYVVYALIYCRHRISGLSACEAKERMTDE